MAAASSPVAAILVTAESPESARAFAEGPLTVERAEDLSDSVLFERD